jgi:hypothetical protein
MNNQNFPKLSRLTYIGQEINSLPERCNVDKMTIEYVNRGIENRNLFEMLKNDFGRDIDFSIFDGKNDETNLIYNALYDVSGGLEAMEDKLGIEKSGQRLLVAYIIEAIQRKVWYT